MSIHEKIRDLQRQGRLFFVEPISGRYLVRRQLFVVKPVWKLLNGQWNSTADEERFSAFYADLDLYTGGEELRKKYFKPILPRGGKIKNKFQDGIFEIKSVKPKPGLRLFGRFAFRNCFIGMVLDWRAYYGEFESAEYKRLKQNLSQQWNGLFNPYSALPGGSLRDYVSNATLE